MIKRILIVGILIFSTLGLVAQENMNNQKLGTILYVMSDTIAGNLGAWQFIVNGVPMLCFTDEVNNRMRIISPVKKVEELTDEEMKASMEANFHSALDVRYAIAEDLVWVAFIHPLAELTKEQAVDAVKQVYNAVMTFGASYSSTELVFPKSKEEEPERKIKRN